MKNFLRAVVLALCTLVVTGNAQAAGYYVGEHEAVALIGPEGGDPAEIWAGIRAKLAELDGGAESA